MLKVVLLVLVGAPLVLVLGAMLRDALRIARFGLTSRRLDPAPPDDDVSAGPFDKKLTPDEQARHLAALWAQLDRPGLSGAKLNALRSLRERQRAFFLHGWVERVEWRARCRLARESTGAAQAEALGEAKAMAASLYEQFSPADLALYLTLHDAGEARSIEQHWAERQLANNTRWVRQALRRLEAFAESADAAGAASFRALFESFVRRNDRGRAIALVARLRKAHEAPAAELMPRLQRLVAPGVALVGGRVVLCSRAASASFHLVPLRFEASPPAAAEWLRSPPGLDAATPQPEALRGPLRLWRIPFTSRDVGLVSPPALRGAFSLRIEAKPASNPLWSRLLPDVPLVDGERREFVYERQLEAVLTLTETGAALWAVDRETGRPLPGLEVSFWLRGRGDDLPREIATRTDERGLASLSGLPFWQLGASVRRPGSHGAEEFLFLTHNHDVSTSDRAAPEERLYAWLARPLYRPGELVQGTLVGRAKGAEGPSARLPEGRSFTLEVRGPRGNAVAQLTLSLSRFGTAPFSFTLPGDVPLGRYTFALLAYAPRLRVEGHLQVEEFVTPEFRASLRALAPPRWGQRLTLRFESSYFFGGPVAGGSGVVELRRRPWRHAGSSQWPPAKAFFAETTLAPLRFQTDAEGVATIELPPRAPLDLRRRFDGYDLGLVARLRDASGKTCEARLSLSFGRLAHAVEVTAAERLRLPGEPLPLKLRWSPAPEGEPATYDLEITLRSGGARRRHKLRVSTAEAEARLPLRLEPGEWAMQPRLVGQRRPTQTSQTFWVLSDRLRASSPQLLLSRDELGPDAPVRVAFVAPEGPLSVLLVGNRGPNLTSCVLSSEGNAAWVDLPLPEGPAPQVQLQAWRSYVEGEHRLLRLDASLRAPEPPRAAAPALGLALSFPSATARPGSLITLAASLDPPADAPAELLCAVVDEAIVSIVSAPVPAIEFFERPPSSATAQRPAWSASWAGAQVGRPLAHAAASFAQEGDELDEVASSMMARAPLPYGSVMPAAAPQSMSMVMAPRRRSAVSGFASLSAAPLALVAAGGAALANKLADGARGGDEAGAPEGEAPVALRSDFSAEAAWYPGVPFDGARGRELTVALPDALTTWRASALLIALDERLGEAEARVKTQKPLMVRLQAPRFLQERDAFALRVLVDSRAEGPLTVRASIEAPGLSLGPAAEGTFSLPAGGQHKLEAQARVGEAAGNVRLRALARSPQDPEAADLEERVVPWRPYGAARRQTAQGVLAGGRELVRLSLPERRRKERTELTVRLDRGLLDAVIDALGYLREYPYGCVEQTCSRLLPHLVWERVVARTGGEHEGYRSQGQQPAGDAVAEGLARLLATQNRDGGFGWWPSGRSDVWMTAYLLVSFSIARRPAAPALEAASRFLRANLLNADNPDDADAFAAFALAWGGEAVDGRVFDVLLPRWDGLSLTEQAKLCLPLRAARHPEARPRTASVLRKLVRAAKKALKRIDADESPDKTQWFVPRATEAIAFFMLALLHEAGAAGAGAAGAGEVGAGAGSAGAAGAGEPDAPGEHGEALGLLASFLLVHRTGARWHSTRDTALAVLALLAHEERLSRGAAPASLRVTVNGRERLATALGGLEQPAPRLVLRDDALADGENALEFDVEGADARSAAQPRHYSVELSYHEAEDEIAPSEEGLRVERAYWLLDDKQNRLRRLKSGDRVALGQRLRIVLGVRATRPRRYLLLEDPKLAGCEPLAKQSGPGVCAGRCDHVELRADRTAIFLSTLGEQPEELSYDVEAQTPGVFTAMPAQIETMYDSGCAGSSGSFRLTVEP
ncbi:MAG TPA: alpha-2-macroglobulin family protein [Polyangiaceae bacterium]|nr:alpha-2-macroglobulin family protein [Polyangiaceae bacterium]